MNIFDGHIHTPYCPHGTKDTFNQYIERAIELGYKGMTFTEHAPLPSGFSDPTPDQDSGMQLDDLENYIEHLSQLKKEYKNDLRIKTGLEIDYIEGFERETVSFLDHYGPYLDDSILSVHFLKTKKGYHCMDYSPDVYEKLLEETGSIHNLYSLYYDTLKKSVKSELGAYKPKRIGHISLVMKFRKKYPNNAINKKEILETLDMVSEGKFQLDYNGSGVNKPLCREPYPSDWIISEALKRNIPLVYGSDAHQAGELGQGLDKLQKEAPLSQPG
ncbi:histidinol-phosphatase HisJ [Bacillus sp. Marseille-Q3570]|uniref:histidinol-phosphatase HisJ n=1 Tax=Bacillus sp. Marseille-Q3570 TaxID=2963522 RepID=UPI0021B76A0A|nr:histidinol-phosphatase HisJ [Bacillus sp. Marseille-Q3570]